MAGRYYAMYVISDAKMRHCRDYADADERAADSALCR